jgi:Bacterial toxin 35
VRLRRLAGAGAVCAVGLALVPTPALASNCGSLTDCWDTIAAAVVVAVALAVIIAVGVAVLPVLALEVTEAAAIEAAAAEAAAAEAAAAEAAAAEAAAAEAAAAAGAGEAAAAETAAAGTAVGEAGAAGTAAGDAAAGEAAASESAAGETAAGEATQASRAADAGVESAQADPNKVTHIFDNPGHNWDATGLDQAGNWNLIKDTLAQNFGQLPESGVFQVEQTFEGYTVTVRGAIVNGAVRIGSAWVNAL